jgi:DtxR family Mn-dependent transcriptional regulator
MTDPIMALTVATLLFLIVGLFLWLRNGSLAKRQKARQHDSRMLMEDALKYLFDCEQRKQTCTSKNLAVSLAVDHEKSDQIIVHLKKLGLVREAQAAFFLSDEGRAYALRVIRIHRLWERYLAEETGIPEKDWHAMAEIQEHKLSIDEANELSRQMGYPRYDPHGDPIPTRAGDLPPDRGRPLSDFKEGNIVRVLHIEDEPPELYAEIIDKGITLDSQLEILKKLENGLHILTSGMAQTLSIDMAENITGILSAKKSEAEELFQPLSSLERGEKAEVIRISRICRGSQRRRLMDLGVVPGTVITMEMASAGGDPKAYNIRGALIALRKEQADLINIKPLAKAV